MFFSNVGPCLHPPPPLGVEPISWTLFKRDPGKCTINRGGVTLSNARTHLFASPPPRSTTASPGKLRVASTTSTPAAWSTFRPTRGPVREGELASEWTKRLDGFVSF